MEGKQKTTANGAAHEIPAEINNVPVEGIDLAGLSKGAEDEIKRETEANELMKKSMEHLQLGTTEDEEEVVFEPDEEYVARMGGQAASLRQSSGNIKAVGFAAQDEGEKAKVERFSRLHTKYDFIKVKVWLEDHYYIMSRFIVSRMLTLIKVSPEDAIKVALELKKDLVDQGLLSLTQADLEKHLFRIMEVKGYGHIYRERFTMTLKFHHQRVPLIIIIAGTGCMGKSFLATQLAERINVPNVLQTNLVYEFLNSVKDITTEPLIYRRFASKKELLDDFRSDCKMVRDAVKTDLDKALKEGKSIILEGFHIDPALFLHLIEHNSIIPYPKVNQKKLEGEAVSIQPAAENKGNEPKGVILPVIFNMNEKDHRLFVENMLSTSTYDRQFAQGLSEDTHAQTSALLSNLRYIQSYLCRFAPPFQLLEVKAQSFPETLDHLHTVVLEGIQQAFQMTSAFEQ